MKTFDPYAYCLKTFCFFSLSEESGPPGGGGGCDSNIKMSGVLVGGRGVTLI